MRRLFFLLTFLGGCAGHVPECESAADCASGQSCVKWRCTGLAAGGGGGSGTTGGGSGGAGSGGATGRDAGTLDGGFGGGGGGGGGSVELDAGSCGPNNCAGCCSATGQCLVSPDNFNNGTCGTRGEACLDCAAAAGICYSWALPFCAPPPRRVVVSASWASANGGGRGAPFATPRASVMHDGQWVGGAQVTPIDGGLFEVSVPGGDALIEVSGNFIYGDAGALSFDLPGWGRVAQAAIDGGSAEVSLTGLAPTLANDGFTFSSLASGSQFGGAYSNLPTGTTALSASTWPLADWAPLLSWNAGDDLTITQHQTVAGTPPVRSTVASALAVAPPFVNGGLTTVSSALTTAPRSSSMTWNQSVMPYLTSTSLTNPACISDGSYFAVIAVPGDNLVAVNALSQDLSLRLAEVSQYVPDLPTFSRSMSYQSLRRPLLFYGHACHLTVAAPSASPVLFPVFGQSWIDDRLSPSSWPGGVNRNPVLAPVTALQINGVAAWGGVNPTGLTPLVSWQPGQLLPPLVTQAPSGFVVSVYAVDNVGGATQVRLTAAISTRLTSLRLPPGVITGPWFVTVKAELDTGPRPFADRAAFFWGNNATRTEFAMAITAVNQP